VTMLEVLGTDDHWLLLQQTLYISKPNVLLYFANGKSKVVPVLNKAPRHEDVLGV